jgi:hypothetical protein
VVVLRGFLLNFYFVSKTCFCVLEGTTLGSGRLPRGGECSSAHVFFTVARQALRYVVSKILFQVWCFKFEVSAVG